MDAGQGFTNQVGILTDQWGRMLMWLDMLVTALAIGRKLELMGKKPGESSEFINLRR